MPRIARLAFAIGLLLSIRAAEAHAELVDATPKVGGVVSISPKEIVLRFSEGVEPALSGIELASADGTRFPTGKAVSGGGDRTRLVLRLGRALGPGTYRVTWHVVSVDTHRTQGSFTFEVRP